MAKYKSIVTTKAGLELLEKAAYISGSIEFTALKAGNGTYNGTEELSGMTDLKKVSQTFGVGSVSKKESDILVRANMNNNGVTKGYSITEIGLYATDPDTKTEILYAIIIAENGTEDYFPPYADAPTSITLDMYIGLTETAEKVTFEVLPVEGTYTPAESFNEHTNNTNNPHSVTKAQVGLSNVPNVATNDQTPSYTVASSLAALASGEKLSVAFGKIAKAVSSLISHLADTVSHITSAERTSWNKNTTDISNIINGATKVPKATSADSATKATNDGNGKNIASTYSTKQEVEEILAGISDGSTPMGNAAALGGKTSAEWQSEVDAKASQTAVDNIQTTSKGEISTASWYRVAEYSGYTLSHAKGSLGNSCIISIKEQYYNNPNGEYLIKLSSVNAKQRFSLMSAIQAETRQSITKIRYVYDTTTNKAYIELYGLGSPRNAIVVDILLPTDALGYAWKKLDFEPTSETVSGVTVTTTYDIPANASPVTDLDIAKELTNHEVKDYFRGATETELDTLYANLHTNSKDLSYYKALVVHGVAHSVLGGGTFYVEGFRHSANYGYQRIVSYGTSGTKTFAYERSMYDGSWISWERTSYKSDLANYLPKTGGETNVTLSSADATTRYLRLKNSKRQITHQIGENGYYYLTDNTNGKVVIDSTVDSINTFYGTATGNATKEEVRNIQSISKANLSQTGWYRVAEMTAPEVNTLRGNYADQCDLLIKQAYVSGGQMLCHLEYAPIYNEHEFILHNVHSKGNQTITKIRHVYNQTENKAWIEVYYALNTVNSFAFICSNGSNSFGYDYAYWKAITPTLTSETVSGVTVTTTYDIPANASPVTDLDLENYLPVNGGGRINRASPDVISLNSTGTLDRTLIEFLNQGTLKGYLGFDGEAPIFIAKDGTTAHKLLHEGNADLKALTESDTITTMSALNKFLEKGKLKFACFEGLTQVGLSGSIGVILSIPYNNRTGMQMAFDTMNNRIKFRVDDSNEWDNWAELLHTDNSAKVRVQSSPLTSATSDSIRVW